MTKRDVVLSVLCLFFCLTASFSFASDQDGGNGVPSQGDSVRLTSPADGTEVIAKKPEITLTLGALSPESLLVLLDSVDVTGIGKRAGQTFSYRPVSNLAAGEHVLVVSGKDRDGKDVRAEYRFRVRHYASFDEARSTNQLSVISNTLLGKPGYDDDTPYRKVEGNIASDNKVKKGAFEVGVTTNVRYLEQSEQVADPLRRGFDVANWTARGTYTLDLTKVTASLGDVQVNESAYTVNGLARKGTVLEAEYGPYQMRAFTMAATPRFGLDGGIGIGDASTDELISGVSVGGTFFDKKLTVKTIYVGGGDPAVSAPTTTAADPLQQNPLGTSTTIGMKKSNTLGFLVGSDFFAGKMKTEVEAAFSSYNPDTSQDDVGASRDGAYRLKVEGGLGRYIYSGAYEFIGRDFGTVGNQAAEKDKQRIILSSGLKFDTQAVNVTVFRANDNVRNDDLLGRTYDYNGNLTYSYFGIKSLPLSFSYVRDHQMGSGGETPRVNKLTDTWAGSIGYTSNKWGLGFTTAYSSLNDKTGVGPDTQTATFTLAPTYNGETLMASSSLSLNRTFVTAPRIWTDTYTLGLNVRKTFLAGLLTFDTANTYTKGKADDGSSDQKTTNLTGTVSYSLKSLFRNVVDPSVGIRSSYVRITDKVTPDNQKEETRVFLVLTLAAPLSF
jgi:hypothetical protein